MDDPKLEKPVKSDLTSQVDALVSTVIDGQNLRIYRLIPTAANDDPNRLDATTHDELVVCAVSAGDARIVAADRELNFLEIDAAPAEDVTTVNASMSRNEKLYSVVDDGPAIAGIERGIIDGIVRVDNIKPSQTN